MKDIWDKQTKSRHRFDDDPVFYDSKAREHLSFLSSEERELPCLDLGCGDGGLTQQLARYCNLVEVVDYSASMLTKARERLRDFDNLRVFEADMVDHARETSCVVWMSTAGASQYLNRAGMTELLHAYLENRKVAKFCLFDTIDPDRFRLWEEGRGYYGPLKTSRARMVVGALRSLKDGVTGAYCRPLEQLVGIMGYGYRPHFWLELDPEEVDVRFYSSRFYEYRYHVILKKRTTRP